MCRPDVLDLLVVDLDRRPDVGGGAFGMDHVVGDRAAQARDLDNLVTTPGGDRHLRRRHSRPIRGDGGCSRCRCNRRRKSFGDRFRRRGWNRGRFFGFRLGSRWRRMNGRDVGCRNWSRLSGNCWCRRHVQLDVPSCDASPITASGDKVEIDVVLGRQTTHYGRKDGSP
jgi:hypothetical protein